MIGIFDSGLGGLTVVKEVMKLLPEYQLLYLGDLARMPYGNRSQDLIYQFTEQAVAYLFNQGCELVILACNTASAEALKKIQQEWLPAHYPDKRVLGVIRPLAEEAALASRFGRVGLVGTTATINSGTYEEELKNLRAGLKIFTQACPLLVPLIEEGWLNRPETIKIMRYYLRPLKYRLIDTLILGCTHYSILHKQFQQICGKRIKALDSSYIVAQKLKDYLVRHPEIESKLVRSNQHRFLVTDLTTKFKENAQAWLGREIELEKISLN